MQQFLKERVEPKHAALLIVDVQNDFMHPEGALGKSGFDMTPQVEMAPRLEKLIDASRRANVAIIYIRTEHGSWTNSEPWVFRRGHASEGGLCTIGSWGTEFYKVSPDVGDYVLTKHRYSAFQDTELDLVLRSIRARTIICTGVGTNVCVESTARQGYMLDYHVVFVDDCSACSAQVDHEATLRNIRNHFGIVASSEEIMEAWGGA